jgi:hypothetical protein
MNHHPIPLLKAGIAVPKSVCLNEMPGLWPEPRRTGLVAIAVDVVLYNSSRSDVRLEERHQHDVHRWQVLHNGQVIAASPQTIGDDQIAHALVPPGQCLGQCTAIELDRLLLIPGASYEVKYWFWSQLCEIGRKTFTVEIAEDFLKQLATAA